MLRRRRSQRSFIQYLLHCGRAILRGIDERDIGSEHACNRTAKQRIMGAAKHERVDPVGEERLKISDNDLVRYVVVEQSFFDQRDQQGTCATAHAYIVVGRAQHVFIRAAADRRPCSDYADMPVSGCLQRCSRSRLITPITGMENFLVNRGSATDETVLHATT